MSRAPRLDLGNYVYHVINRANGRAQIFHTDADYKDFEYLLSEVQEDYKMRILAYVIMPNHWHLLLYPTADGSLSKSLHWLQSSHAHRYHSRMQMIGNGHLYQGRYKSFLIEEDVHFLTVLKYIERNPVRAGLVGGAQDWRWSSAYRRIRGTEKERSLLAELPVDLPRDYRAWINTPEPSEALDDVRHSVNRGVSYGDVVLPKNITP